MMPKNLPESLIYFDNSATTPLSEVARSHLSSLLSRPLNPSSTHRLGREATALMREATQLFARLLQMREEEIIITSGATEALNTFLHHVALTKPVGRILSCITEHAAIREPLRQMGEKGWQIELTPVNQEGEICLEAVEESLKDRSLAQIQLLVFMAANNETGVCHPIEALGRLAERYGALLLVDGVAAAGKSELKLYPGVTAIAMSAHKMHGPAGVGVLALAPNVRLEPLLVGGGQQRSRRSGTLNTPLVSAAAIAVKSYLDQPELIQEELRALRDVFEERLIRSIGAKVNGQSKRAAHISNLYFPGIDAETLLIQLDQAGVIASHGSACQAGAMELSHVLLAMHTRERARSSVRFSFGRQNTRSEVEDACAIIESAVAAQRALL